MQDSRLTPDWFAKHQRFVALHKLAVKSLPTKRIVAWSVFGFVFGCVIAALFFGSGSTILASAIVVLLGVEALHIFERVRSIRTGRIGAGIAERILDHWATSSAETGWDVVEAALNPSAEAIETAADLGLRGIARVFRPRKQKWMDEIVAATEGAMQAGEKRVVSLRVTLTAHGYRRFLLYASFGLASAKYVRNGALTITDRRLIFHRIRGTRSRRRFELLVTEPLKSLVVLEWFKGTGLSERWQQVLILRRPDGSVLRMMMLRLYWRDEARATFELVASAAAGVPPSLRRFWGLPQPERPVVPTRARPERRRRVSAAIACVALIALVATALLETGGGGEEDPPVVAETTTSTTQEPAPVSPAAARREKARARLRAWVATDATGGCRDAGHLPLAYPRRPRAGIRCRLRGATSLIVFGYARARGAVAEWRTQAEELESGFCSGSVWNARGPWHWKGERKTAGRLSCYDDKGGTAWIEWTDTAERILALASRGDGNHAALYRAWLRAF